MADKITQKKFIEVDVMFIKKIIFMVSVLRKIQFNTVQKLANRNKATLIGQIDTIIEHYRK